MFLSDRILACRLESAEGTAASRFVDARLRLYPDSGAQWIRSGGVYAMYDGASSPVTQTFALGMYEAPGNALMEQLEDFFTSRGAPVLHEVSPLAGYEALALLNERGYQPLEFTSVMFLPLVDRSHAGTAASPELTTHCVDPSEAAVWARTIARGWSESAVMDNESESLSGVVAESSQAALFLARWNQEPIAAAALHIHEGVALLAGASTIPAWRNRGAQRTLLESRLRYASAQGCDLAMVCAEPGSTSQRNAEREGFRIAYTRIKWKLAR